MMDKLKLNFSLSDRDKKIVMIILAFALLAAAYFFGYKNFMEQADKYDKETAKLTTKHQDLTAKAANKDKYIADAKKYDDQTSAILASYDNGLSQDGSLMFMNTLEKANNTWIKSMSMTPVTAEYQFGKVYSTNPNGGGLVYTTDMKGVSSTYTLSYETSYKDWKKVLSYLNGYYSKHTVDSISMTYNQIQDKVSGSLVVTAYAITGAERNYKHPNIKLPTSTVNLFKSASFNPGDFDIEGNNGDYILSDYDYYLNLNSATTSAASVVIGKKDDTTGKSVLSSASNEKVNASIKFSGSNGRYKVSYKIGDATYPATEYNAGADFVPGNGLELLVMSSARMSDADKSGVSLTLINETDMKLNVKICNEDDSNPRLSIASKTGSIEIYK